jgi:hypothetical protein
MGANNGDFHVGVGKLYHWSPKEFKTGEVVPPTHSLRESAALMDEGMSEEGEDFCMHGGSHDHLDPTPQAWASTDPDYYANPGWNRYEVEPVKSEDMTFDPHNDDIPEVSSKSGFRVVKQVK